MGATGAQENLRGPCVACVELDDTEWCAVTGCVHYWLLACVDRCVHGVPCNFMSDACLTWICASHYEGKPQLQIFPSKQDI